MYHHRGVIHLYSYVHVYTRSVDSIGNLYNIYIYIYIVYTLFLWYSMSPVTNLLSSCHPAGLCMHVYARTHTYTHTRIHAHVFHSPKVVADACLYVFIEFSARASNFIIINRISWIYTPISQPHTSAHTHTHTALYVRYTIVYVSSADVIHLYGYI